MQDTTLDIGRRWSLQSPWLERFYERKCYTLRDALKGQTDDASVSNLLQSAKTQPRMMEFLRRHTLTGDDAKALGEVNRLVVEAALPNTSLRDACWVVETQSPSARFILAAKGKAYQAAKGAAVQITPETYTSKDINADIEYKATAEWDENFLEDAAWPAAQRLIQEAGRAVEEMIATKIKDTLGGISNSDLAGGGPVSLAATMTYANLVDMRSQVEQEDFRPDVTLLHPREANELLKDQAFIDSLQYGEFVDKARGEFARDVLGMRFIKSTIIPAGTVYTLDSRWALGLVIRRDHLTKTYEDARQSLFGVVDSVRIGIDTLRTQAVAKGTGS